MNLLIGSSHPAPQRPCHAPRPCPARLRRVGGRVEKRGVTAAGRGSGIGRQLESPRNAPSGCEARCDRRKGRGSPAGLCLLFVPVSNLSVLLLEPPPSPLRGIPSPCPSVFPSPQTGFAASRPPSSIPDSFAGFHILASAFPEPSRSSLLPPSGCGSPSRELALPRPPWTTIPSEPSGRRLGCGQVTESPDLRIAVGSPGGELTDCPGVLLTSSRVEPKCPRNLKSFSTSLF